MISIDLSLEDDGFFWVMSNDLGLTVKFSTWPLVISGGQT